MVNITKFNYYELSLHANKSISLAVAVIRDQILYLVLKILDLVLLVSILYTVYIHPLLFG